jgi:hypothetical protein
MTNRDDQIEKAVVNLIDSWDMNSLVSFAIEDQIQYYLHLADDDEIESLIEEFGGDNVSH